MLIVAVVTVVVVVVVVIRPGCHDHISVALLHTGGAAFKGMKR